MEGTECLVAVLICSPSTWEKAGSPSPTAKLVAAIAQPFENARLDTFMNYLLVANAFRRSKNFTLAAPERARTRVHSEKYREAVGNLLGGCVQEGSEVGDLTLGHSHDRPGDADAADYLAIPLSRIIAAPLTEPKFGLNTHRS
jgi:hypothetical protein